VTTAAQSTQKNPGEARGTWQLSTHTSMLPPSERSRQFTPRACHQMYVVSSVHVLIFSKQCLCHLALFTSSLASFPAGSAAASPAAAAWPMSKTSVISVSVVDVSSIRAVSSQRESKMLLLSSGDMHAHAGVCYKCDEFLAGHRESTAPIPCGPCQQLLLLVPCHFVTQHNSAGHPQSCLSAFLNVIVDFEIDCSVQSTFVSQHVQQSRTTQLHGSSEHAE